jgi:WD40 repeat protein
LANDQLATIGAGEQTLNVFDLNSGAPVRSTFLAGAAATALAASRDGTRLAVATDDAKVRVVNAADGAVVRTIAAAAPAASLAFSNDGKRLLAVAASRAIVYDADEGAAIEVLTDPAGVAFAAFAAPATRCSSAPATRRPARGRCALPARCRG